MISGLENDFALDASGAPLTVNSAQAGLSAPNAAGTPYGGASAPLRAKTVVTPGRAHGHTCRSSTSTTTSYDTAVFADALRTSNESAATCVRGSQAIGPGARDHRARPGLHVAHAASRRSPARPATRRATTRP